MRRRRILRAGLVAGAGLMVSPGLLVSRGSSPTTQSGATPAPPGDGSPQEPASLPLSGTYRGVHDPCIMREGDTYYLFCTGPGLMVRTSPDLRAWTLRDDVFGTIPAWATQAVPGANSLWAADISYFGDRYHLYYSVSTFGSNLSCIGLATTATLDPDSPDFGWVDQGVVLQSTRNDTWNAIDPNVVFDADGQTWLAFGSHWGGIKMRRLDGATGHLAGDDATLYALASRVRTPPGAIEAPFIVEHAGVYYLFVSFDACCRGVQSTYNIRVGRAEGVTGPYGDRSGVPMLEGGGTLVLAGDDHWRGPGHCAVLREEAGDMLVYHAYDATFGGVASLRISPLHWDGDGWPFVPPA